MEKKLSEVDVQISFYGPDQDQILISETKRVLLRHLVLFFSADIVAKVGTIMVEQVNIDTVTKF